MNEGKLVVDFEVAFGDPSLAKALYSSMLADFREGELVRLSLSRETLMIKVIGSSYSKVRGATSTLFRILRMINELYEGLMC